MGLARRTAGSCAMALAALCAGAAGEDPKADEKRLKLDIDRLVKERLDQDADQPRFEENVDVVARSPDALLGRFVEGADLDCEPAGVGAPTEVEMREVRPGNSPSLDLLAIAGAVLSKLKKKGAPRYFVYRVTRAGKASYLLREGEAPRGWQPGPEGAIIELVEGFPDRGSAVAAWRRLERGLPGPPTEASPPPPFLATTCKPGP